MEAVQHLINYKPGHFETEPPGEAMSPPMAGKSHTLTVGVHKVRHTLRGVNAWKAMGPHGVLGWVLKDRTDQLAEIFTKIFNLSQSHPT